VDFFRARARGDAHSLLGWLNEEVAPGYRPRNDRLLLSSGDEARLSDVISEAGGRARLWASPLDMTFLDVS
jgi:hypothetical protein